MINPEITEKITFRAVCPHCNADLHCCKNCSFYDTGASNQCHETIDEHITDKEKANFCEYFSAKLHKSNVPLANNAAQAKKNFDNLFGGL